MYKSCSHLSTTSDREGVFWLEDEEEEEEEEKEEEDEKKRKIIHNESPNTR